ncbi:MAG: histidine phosphatase family protein [Patescibacteria group bacterium]
MKMLIVVRHGDYSEAGDWGLTPLGTAQISILGRNLLQMMPENPRLAIYSSDALRAVQSAQVLAVVFGHQLKAILVDKLFYPSGGDSPDCAGTLSVVMANSEETDVVVLVTHCEFLREFPRYFGVKVLGVSLDSKEIGKGQAWVIDLQAKTLTRALPW